MAGALLQSRVIYLLTVLQGLVVGDDQFPVQYLIHVGGGRFAARSLVFPSDLLQPSLASDHTRTKDLNVSLEQIKTGGWPFSWGKPFLCRTRLNLSQIVNYDT